MNCSYMCEHEFKKCWGWEKQIRDMYMVFHFIKAEKRTKPNSMLFHDIFVYVI